MAAPTEAEVAQVAASYSVPPAVLWGLVKQLGPTPNYSLPTATTTAYGISTSQMQSDPLMALSVVARTLA